ncbi:MAG TPA: hypothetical protein VEW46_21660 [Pyrinomonadaceae bacterium]|nr:hypothetical protein [Pyrinomonadaceae bacterium]
MHKHVARGPHLAISIGFALTLILCLPILLVAQRRIPISENERNERDLAEREWLLRTIGKFKKKDLEVGGQSINLQQVKKDFEGMQLANNDILVALASNRPLDPKQISNNTSRIRRFATALKNQLSLPVPDEDKTSKEQSVFEGPLRATLLHLDASIARFVSNPIFKSTGHVVDAQHSVKASRDLDNIINLSDRIRKTTAQRQK